MITNLDQITSGGSAPAANREESRDPDALQLYLAEIGKTPLLTLDQELQLAARIRKGE